MAESSDEKVLLPHHEQQELCTTRLPYRQGRKLTAVKVYTISNESNHLLIFGVPSIDLRNEVKVLFSRFGKLLHFIKTTEHPGEVFTETYHARFEKIQSARMAKKMMDTKNFYGGSLHVCYAPEFESPDETRQKIHKRKQDVLFRLRNLDTERAKEKSKVVVPNIEAVIERDIAIENNKRSMNMSVVNTIILNKKMKKFKPVPIFNEIRNAEDDTCKNYSVSNYDSASCSKTSDLDNKFTVVSVSKPVLENNSNVSKIYENYSNVSKIDENDSNVSKVDEIDIVDFTSTEKEVVSNINEALNYNKFGNEIVKKVPYKPVNKISFNFNNRQK